MIGIDGSPLMIEIGDGERGLDVVVVVVVFWTYEGTKGGSWGDWGDEGGSDGEIRRGTRGVVRPEIRRWSICPQD